VAHSTSTDEGTDVKQTAQLAVFVARVNENFQFVEQLSELVRTKEKKQVLKYSLNSYPFYTNSTCVREKIIGFVCDRGPAMIGRNNGAAATLKNERI
jgi:hypothetical protein